MTIECPCQNCNAVLRFDETRLGETIQCPHCNLDTLLYRPSNAAKETVRAPLSAPRPQARLEKVRKHSCYRATRTVINVIYIVAALAAPLPVIRLVLLGSGYRMDTPDTMLWLTMLGAAVAAALVELALLAMKQAALVVFDIADSLLLHHSERE
jgi:hypothetical protein